MFGPKALVCLVVVSPVYLAIERNSLQVALARGDAPIPRTRRSGPRTASLGCPGPQLPPVTDLKVRRAPNLGSQQRAYQFAIRS